jgi:tetratricopeptide (TPR) repeat protein
VASTWQALRANGARRAAEAAAAAEAEQRREAVEAEQRAQSEKDNANAALEFISQGILSQASPDKGADPDITLRTVVDQIAQNLEKGLKQPPLVEASIRHALGNIYANLERYPEAAGHFKRAYAIRQSKLGERHPDTIRTMVSYGFPSLWWNSEDGTSHSEKSVDEGKGIALRAWALAKEVLGPDDFRPGTLQRARLLGIDLARDRAYAELARLVGKNRAGEPAALRARGASHEDGGAGIDHCAAV